MIAARTYIDRIVLYVAVRRKNTCLKRSRIIRNLSVMLFSPTGIRKYWESHHLIFFSLREDISKKWNAVPRGCFLLIFMSVKYLHISVKCLLSDQTQITRKVSHIPYINNNFVELETNPNEESLSSLVR